MYWTTLEWGVVHADVVVRGVCTAVEEEDPGFTRSVTVRVLEVLKGQCPYPQLVIRGNPLGGDTVALRGASEALVLLDRLSDPPTNVFFFHERLAVVALDGSGCIYNNDLDCLSDRDPILHAARAAASIDRAHAPPDASVKLSQSVTCLRDNRLEARGLSLVRSRHVDDRITGMRILSNYQCDRSIMISHVLLDDRGVSGTDIEKWESGHYIVRGLAIEALHAWGVDVAEPAVTGPVVVYRPLSTLWNSFRPFIVLAACTVVMLLALMRRKWPLGSVVVDTLAIGCIALIGTLWWRGHHVVDELAVARFGWRAEVASYRGQVTYRQLNQWTVPIPPSIATMRLDRSSDLWASTPGERNRFVDVLGLVVTDGTTVGPEQKAHNWASVRLPCWMLLLIVVAVPARHIAAAMRRWVRHSRGCCPQCGYDLRASALRCPECGRPKDHALQSNTGVRG